MRWIHHESASLQLVLHLLNNISECNHHHLLNLRTSLALRHFLRYVCPFPQPFVAAPVAARADSDANGEHKSLSHTLGWEQKPAATHHDKEFPLHTFRNITACASALSRLWPFGSFPPQWLSLFSSISVCSMLMFKLRALSDNTDPLCVFKFPERMARPFPRPSARAPHYYMCYRLHLARCNRPVVCSSKFIGKGDAICSAPPRTSLNTLHMFKERRFLHQSIHGARDIPGIFFFFFAVS